MKIPKLFKKAAAFVMAAVTALSIMPATAFAAGDIGTISFSHTYDSNGNAMRYNSSANIGGYTAGGTGNYKYRMFVDGENAFCIQPGVPLKTGNTLKKASSDTWNALSANQKKAVGLALLYGYQGNRNNLSGSDDEKWLATQTLVWEFVTGCREATGSYNQTSTTVYSLHFGSNYANSGARAVYDQIVAMLREHNTIPSFMSGGKNDITKELAYKDGKYSITLTDSNGVLSDYSFSSSDSNVSVSKSGNKLTISSTVAISGSVRITAKRNNVPTVSSSAKLIAYGDPNLQDLVTGVENADTVSAYINIETPTGTIALKKTSEDGVVEGISFTIKGDNFNKTVKTGKDGSVSVEGLFPGTYTVTEQSIDRYEPQKTQTVTLIGGKTSTVTFSNTLKRGSLEIVKTSEDNLVEGMKFHLYGTSLSGLPVDEYAVTDKNGLATVIDFEQLGVDRLFIDESHFYKNLYLYTKMRNVGGIAQTEAQKSSDLFMKCRYLDEITGNRGTVFATGTPVSNSMVELYSVQRYLQYDTLAQNGLQHFDSWASTFGETVTALELAPEGTNYRAKTRFAKFYNLPELMQMFREVADIQTADMLKLPVPKVNYHNIKTKPSEIQTEMVASLAKRAEKVRARLVEPNIDNMLKITNDGRKLALDQRMIDPMLPDDPESKVNACVDNVYRIWEEHADTKATQLVFCDLSTPKNDGTFNVYDDMREKLIARGIPAEQIRFIHEATTDAQKKELFGKVRSGEVRVLFGSTPKMGAGTNVQDRLIAIHNLDCPWRPSDLEQRQGRIERQGNMFPEVEVYRYVTEQTFDAYLYQLVESKQKFISQIMTSKSPVRSVEDVDEVALSLAEVKMLATGDARFKEKMDLDIQVSKLRVLKQSYLSEHYDLEDRVLKYYPQTIKEYEERIAGYENDVALAKQHKPQGEDKFCPMTLKGVTYTEKADAGEMLLAICKDYPMSAPTEIGSYRGFRMEIYYDTVNAHYCMNLCGKAKHKVDLGADALGNLTRIENELSKLPARLEAAKTKKAETIAQLETAKEEIKKPFAFEDELKEKTERLNALNIELNLNEKDTSVMDTEPEQTEEQPERKCASRER